MNRSMMTMFTSPSRSARQRSPCVSPVRELARALRRPCSPKPTSHYQTIKDPIISKTCLTMTGGFHDLRPRSPRETFDDDNTGEVSPRSRSATPTPAPSSLENNYGPIPTVVRSDSITSCGSLSPILRHKAKTDVFKDTHLVKVPRKAFQSFIQTLSPRLSKKVFNSPTEQGPTPPIWPTVMDTYARGISRSTIENLSIPDEPSLTSLRASAALEEKRNFREALKSFAENIEQRGDVDSFDYGSDSDDRDDDDQYYDYGEQPSTPKLQRKNGTGAHRSQSRIQVQELQERMPSPYPADLLYLEQEVKNIPLSFLDEPLTKSLGDIDLDSVPTVELEELNNGALAEVRNVHVTCDYIILETGPPLDQYTV